MPSLKRLTPIRKLKEVPPPPPTRPWTPLVETFWPFAKVTETMRRICDSKHHYEIPQEAWNEAVRHRHNMYRCGICGTWHLTSPKPSGLPQPEEGSHE